MPKTNVLLGTFLEELDELLDGLRSDLAALAAAGPADQLDLGERVYRGVHTLKGSAHAVEQEEIGAACEDLEVPLKAARNARVPLDAATTARVRQVLDELAAIGARLRGEISPLAAAPAPATDDDSVPFRVLIAEDSKTQLALGKSILEAAGYEVHTAVDGLEAWRLLEEHGADLVVSDVEMPGLDGVALTERIRSSKRFRNLPVVLLTSLDRPVERQRGLAAGADAYLIKGRQAGDGVGRTLLEVVEKFLSRDIV